MSKMNVDFSMEPYRRELAGEAAALVAAAGCNAVRLPLDAAALDGVLRGPRVLEEGDAMVLRGADGALCGYAALFSEPDLDAAMCAVGALAAALPEGGRLLAQAALERVRAKGLGEMRANVRSGQPGEAMRSVLDGMGFKQVRVFQNMRLERAHGRAAPGAEGFRLRPMRADEAEALRDVQNASFDGSFGFSANSTADIEGMLGQPSQAPERVLFATEGERVAGYVWFGPDSAADSAARAARVEMLGVLPQWRGRGLGAALMEAALEAMDKRGFQDVTLQVDSQNGTGRRLYARLGFVRYEDAETWARRSG